MVLFLVENCSLIPKMYKFCCLEVNVKCYRFKLIKLWRNLKISYILTLFDLLWLKLTFCFYIFGISEQFAIRKSTISIYRATSIFDLHMRIFNLQGLGLLTNLKKKEINYAEIEFTSHHSFLRVKRDQFLPNCKKPTLIFNKKTSI
jgi:hypothetical protein